MSEPRLPLHLFYHPGSAAYNRLLSLSGLQAKTAHLYIRTPGEPQACIDDKYHLLAFACQ